MISAQIKSSGYENIVTNCPICDQEVVFNRASDLCILEPISGTNVSCQECGKEFWLNGDSVNERHESILFDCQDLLSSKKYMNCILLTCQAYEMFFSLYLRVYLLYVPFGNSTRDSNSLERLNELSKKLKQKTKGFAFEKMRGSFFQLIVGGKLPSTLDEAEICLNGLGSTLPKDDALKSLTDKKLTNLLVCVKKTKINQLRNKVAHKIGYRPTRIEADEAWKEAKSTLFPLTRLLRLHDEVNWYRSGSA